MLIIRLQRVGRRNHAEFRVVVTEHARAAKSSSYREILGHYSPHTNTCTVNVERVKYWLSVGAHTSPTVHNLLVTQGVVQGEKVYAKVKAPEVVLEETKKVVTEVVA